MGSRDAHIELDGPSRKQLCRRGHNARREAHTVHPEGLRLRLQVKDLGHMTGNTLFLPEIQENICTSRVDNAGLSGPKTSLGRTIVGIGVPEEADLWSSLAGEALFFPEPHLVFLFEFGRFLGGKAMPFFRK